jgi:hypothetical protein
VEAQSHRALVGLEVVRIQPVPQFFNCCALAPYFGRKFWAHFPFLYSPLTFSYRSLRQPAYSATNTSPTIQSFIHCPAVGIYVLVVPQQPSNQQHVANAAGEVEDRIPIPL